MRKPAARNERDEHEGVNRADDVVRDPAHRALERLLRRLDDIRMREGALRHVAEPPAHQTVVGQRNTEDALQEERPKVHEQGRAETDGSCAQSVRRFSTRNVPAYGDSWLAL